MTYSFDIFDTCLVRKCGAPRNMLNILANRVFSQSVLDIDRKAFIISRIQAEVDTFSSTQTINDIYTSFSMQHPLLFPKDQLANIEQECEREMLVPVLSMRELIEDIRAQGNQIVYISDMYLSSDFLKEVLRSYGFFKEGDRIFVSCEHGATKANGSLFTVVKNDLGISSFRHWHHYGDNKRSDFIVPRKLGIHTHRVNYEYTPYQDTLRRINNLHYQWGGILSGSARSIAAQSERNQHYDLVLDIIAPLFTTFVYRVMKDAEQKGIKALYFCARDAYPLFRIACKFNNIFPNIKVQYLYISRIALYEGNIENKLGYYKQIGLATNSAYNAIVDVRSTGNTLLVLNNILKQGGYKSVRGYFFELCSGDLQKRLSVTDYYTELDDLYVKNMCPALQKLPSNWFLYELFFPLNTQKRTIGYVCLNNQYKPVFEEQDNKEYRLENSDKYVEWRNNAFDAYVENFIMLGLLPYADEIFETYVIPQMTSFFQLPNKHYLLALEEFYGEKEPNCFVPYVEKSIWRLPLNVIQKRTLWKRGTIVSSLPRWLGKFLFKVDS